MPALESAGIAVRMPANWPMNRPARPQVGAIIGGRAPSQLGMDALLDFRMNVTLDGEKLSAAEIKRLLAHSDGLPWRTRSATSQRGETGNVFPETNSIDQSPPAPPP